MTLTFRSPKKVANKILFLVLSLELASILLWGSLTYSASRSELYESISNRLNEVANRASSEISHFFLPIKVEAEVLALNIHTRNADKEIMLHRLMNSRPEVEDASIIRKDGTIEFSVSRIYSSTEKIQYDADLLRSTLMGASSQSDIYLSDHLEPKIKLAFPVDPWNDDIVALLVTINLTWLWDKIQNEKIDSTGYIYIIDEHRKLIVHPDPSLVKMGFYKSAKNIPEILFDNEKQKMQVYLGMNNRKVMGVSHYDTKHKWWLIAEQPTSEGLAPLDRLVQRFILVLIMAMLVTSLIVSIFSKITMRPLEKLRHGISQLSQGTLNLIPVDHSTELGDLTIAFNNMATDLLNKQEELSYFANNDSLTGLHNRHYLYHRMDLEIKEGLEHNQTFALMLIDLDRFKEVNDTLGHKWGDILLRELSKKLINHIKPIDILTRLGGDEFAIIYKCGSSGQALKFARQLRIIIQESITLEGLNVQIDGSIGIAMFPLHATDTSGLLRFADIAMYSAKSTGKGCEVYSPNMDLNSPLRLELIGGLRNAISNDELVLFYQPKIDLTTGKANVLEALIRWQHPEHGLLLPNQFIPLSELSEVIQLLTYWVINQACQDLANHLRDYPYLKIAINISAINLGDTDFARSVRNIIKKNGIETNRIQLEVTETAIMADVIRAQNTIFTLADSGIDIVIDDFGTGYSSMNYLKNLPFNEIKIDKSFVSEMDQDDHENDAVIVRSVIDLAHNLGMAVTSEGVESENIMLLLQMLGCDYAQGYYFSHPVPIEDLLEWLWNNRTQEKLFKTLI